jgi:hypothetical protein
MNPVTVVRLPVTVNGYINFMVLGVRAQGTISCYQFLYLALRAADVVKFICVVPLELQS